MDHARQDGDPYTPSGWRMRTGGPVSIGPVNPVCREFVIGAARASGKLLAGRGSLPPLMVEVCSPHFSLDESMPRENDPVRRDDHLSTESAPLVTSDARKGRLHRDAVAILRNMILSGHFAPGAPLREVAISEKLGMSRTPVREAFRTLAAEGLIQLLANRSVVVSELDKDESAEAFAVLGVLEALAGQFACKRMTEAQSGTLRRLQAELEIHFRVWDRENYTRVNRAIHALIVEAAGNASILLAWNLITPRAERARALNNIDRNRWSAAMERHRQIYAALIERDAPQVGILMQAHFASSIVQTLPEDSEERAGGSPADPSRSPRS